MAITLDKVNVESDVADTHDMPLEVGFSIDSAEYARILRRIGVHDGESAVPVSAFNSSITRD